MMEKVVYHLAASKQKKERSRHSIPPSRSRTHPQHLKPPTRPHLLKTSTPPVAFGGYAKIQTIASMGTLSFLLIVRTPAYRTMPSNIFEKLLRNEQLNDDFFPENMTRIPFNALEEKEVVLM
jgi:hypothetical protein